MKKFIPYLVVGAITFSGCDSKSPPPAHIKYIPDLYQVLSLDIQPSDEKEFELYQQTLNQYFNATNFLKLAGGEQYIFPFKDMLAIYIKESRLDPSAKSTSNARGIAQLMPIAIQEVRNILGEDLYKKANQKPYRDIIFSMVYIHYLTEKIEQLAPDLDATEQKKFVFAAYNLGITTFGAAYHDAGAPRSRDDFAKHLTDMIGVDKKPVISHDDSYNIPALDRFGDARIPDKTYKLDEKNKVSGQKVKETVRYVELTDAIRKFLDKRNQDTYDFMVKRSPDDQIFHVVSQLLGEMQTDGILKFGNIVGLTHRILADNGITDHSPYITKDTVILNEKLLEPYYVDKDIRKFAFEKVDYQHNYYYRSIFQHLLYTNTYQSIFSLTKTDIYKKYNEEDGHNHGDDTKEVVSLQVKQLLDEAIIYYNAQRRIDHDLLKNTYLLLPETKYFDWYLENYEHLKTETSSLIKKQIEKETGVLTDREDTKENIRATGKIYADKKYDLYGNKPLTAPKKTLYVTKFLNPTLSKAAQRNGFFIPEAIILHHTAGMFDETKYGYHDIKAHFYIDRNGIIYQSIHTTFRNDDKIYTGKLPKLNHSGYGTKGSAGALRQGNSDITYEAIGIEIETGLTNGDKDITEKQYKAITELLGRLSSTYSIPQKNILTHSQVAVTNINGSLYRGRKEDPRGFDYKKAGMQVDPFALLDQDVISGEVDPNLLAIQRSWGGKDIKKRSATIEKMTRGLATSHRIHTQNKERKGKR